MEKFYMRNSPGSGKQVVVKIEGEVFDDLSDVLTIETTNTKQRMTFTQCVNKAIVTYARFLRAKNQTRKDAA
jgi:hypothetical protein